MTIEKSPLGHGKDTSSAETEDICDWDEYEDEIAGAKAFASLKESDINKRAWETDDGKVESDREKEQSPKH